MPFGADVGRIMRSGLDAESKIILVTIRCYTEEKDGICVASIDKIATMAALSGRTVIRRINALVDSRWLERRDRGTKSNDYRVNIDAGIASAVVTGSHLSSDSESLQGGRLKCQPVTTRVTGSHLSSDSESLPPTPPLKVVDSSSDFSLAERGARPTLDPAAFQALAALALSCIPPGSRRGGLQLDGASMAKLKELADTFGVEACADGLRDSCPGADRPVVMLAKILKNPRAPDATTHDLIFRAPDETLTPISPELFSAMLGDTK